MERLVMSVAELLHTVKLASRKILYPSIQAEGIEITRYAVIKGILEHYYKLLEMPAEEFVKLAETGTISGYDYERKVAAYFVPLSATPFTYRV